MLAVATATSETALDGPLWHIVPSGKKKGLRVARGLLSAVAHASPYFPFRALRFDRRARRVWRREHRRTRRRRHDLGPEQRAEGGRGRAHELLHGAGNARLFRGHAH